MYPFLLVIVGLGLLFGWQHEGAFLWGGGVAFCGFVAFIEQLYWDDESRRAGYFPADRANELLEAGHPLSEPLRAKLTAIARRSK